MHIVRGCKKHLIVLTLRLKLGGLFAVAGVCLRVEVFVFLKFYIAHDCRFYDSVNLRLTQDLHMP